MTRDHSLGTVRRYAYLNLLVGFVAYFYILGFPNILMPVLYPNIIADMGWSRTAVVSFASWKFVTMTICVFSLSFWADAVSAKLMLVVGSTIIGLSMSAFYFIQTLPMYYFLAVTFGIGTILANIAVKVILSRWFHARQGRVIGFALVGSGVVGVIAPVMTEYISQAYGWRFTVILLSFGVWLVILPMVVLLARNDPADYGYTSAEIDPDREDGGAAPVPVSEHPGFPEIRRDAQFWMVAFAISLIAFVEGGMMQHSKAFLQLDVGFSGPEAAWFFTLTMLISLVGRYLFGWLYDLTSVKGVALCYVFIGLGAVSGLYVAGVVSALLFCLIRGLAHGGVLVDVPLLARHLFGTRSLSRVIAIYTGAYSLGMAAGAWSFGYSHDRFGSYNEIFTLSVLIAAAATWIVIKSTPRFWRARE